ncbi:MAG: hypothetical protein ACK5NN_07870 [Sphingomonadaceae bacterium]
MTNRFRIAAPLIAASLALGLSVPASAAPGSHDRSRSYSWTQERAQDIRQDIRQMDRQINRALSRNAISYRQANRFEDRLNTLQRTYREFARGGFTRQELRILDRRVDALQMQIRREMVNSHKQARNDSRNHRGRYIR